MSARERRTADIVVLGGGAAGLSLAAGGARLGLDVVLFEPAAMGGECLNTGCVPSKALLSAAAAGAPGTPTPFADARAKVRAAITAIEPHDSQERFEGMGVRVIREPARLTGPRTVSGGGVEIKARYIALATGSEPAAPPIPGLAETPFLTNETLWDVAERPNRLAVLGAGAMGVEMAQAFARLGAAVTLIEAADHILPKAEPEHAAVVHAALDADGVDIRAGVRAERVDATPDGGARLALSDGAAVEADRLLVAAGRRIRTEGLGLDAAGVRVEKGRIVVDDKLRTTNRRIFALGDAAGGYMLTHEAGWHASVALRQIAFRAPAKASAVAMPAAVYSDPEYAAVGLSEAEAIARRGAKKIRTAEWKFDHNDRAIAEGRIEGGAKLVADTRGRLLGASVVGPGAGETIALASHVIASGGKMQTLASLVVPYPTRAEILKRAAGSWYEPIVFGPAARGLVNILAKLP